MLKYKHLKIPEDLKGLITKKSTALIIIDMQNDFCAKNYLAETKNSIDICMYKKMINNIKKVIRHVREKDIPIFWISTVTKKDLSTDSSSWFRFRLGILGNNKKTKERLNSFNINNEYLLEGTQGVEIIEDLNVKNKDFKITKYRSSAFHNTNLQKILKSEKIETVVIVGLYSYGCVLATALDAMFHNYFTIVLKDCISGPNKELNNYAKRLLDTRTDLINSKIFINALIQP